MSYRHYSVPLIAIVLLMLVAETTTTSGESKSKQGQQQRTFSDLLRVGQWAMLSRIGGNQRLHYQLRIVTEGQMKKVKDLISDQPRRG